MSCSSSSFPSNTQRLKFGNKKTVSNMSQVFPSIISNSFLVQQVLWPHVGGECVMMFGPQLGSCSFGWARTKQTRQGSTLGIKLEENNYIIWLYMVCLGFTTPRFYVLCPFQWMPKRSNPYCIDQNPEHIQRVALPDHLGFASRFPTQQNHSLFGDSYRALGYFLRRKYHQILRELWTKTPLVWWNEAVNPCKSPSGTGDDSLDPKVPKTGGSSHVDPSRILMLEVLAATPSMENQIQKTCTVNWLAIHDLIGGCNSCSWMLLTAVFFCCSYAMKEGWQTYMTSSHSIP